MLSALLISIALLENGDEFQSIPTLRHIYSADDPSKEIDRLHFALQSFAGLPSWRQVRLQARFLADNSSYITSKGVRRKRSVDLSRFRIIDIVNRTRLFPDPSLDLDFLQYDHVQRRFAVRVIDEKKRELLIHYPVHVDGPFYLSSTKEVELISLRIRNGEFVLRDFKPKQ